MSILALMGLVGLCGADSLTKNASMKQKMKIRL